MLGSGELPGTDIGLGVSDKGSLSWFSMCTSLMAER